LKARSRQWVRLRKVRFGKKAIWPYSQRLKSLFRGQIENSQTGRNTAKPGQVAQKKIAVGSEGSSKTSVRKGLRGGSEWGVKKEGSLESDVSKRISALKENVKILFYNDTHERQKTTIQNGVMNILYNKKGGSPQPEPLIGEETA